MKSIEDADLFINTKADDLLRQQGRNAERSLIIELILREVGVDIHRIMRAIRLDYDIAYKELWIKFNMSNQNADLLLEVLAATKAHPIDEEIVKQFVGKIC